MANVAAAPQLNGHASPPTISVLAESSNATRYAAVGVIFLVSVAAAGFPTAAQRIQAIRIPSLLFFIGKHFGTGVILSTAFIHLLSDAFTNLTELRTFGYKNWPGAILLGSLLVIFLIEYTSTVYVESVATKREASDKPLPSSPSLPPPAMGNGSTILVAPINESPVPSYFQLPPDLERPRVNHPELSQSNHSHSRRRPSSSHDGHPNERSPLMGRRTSSAMRDAYFDVYMHHHDHAHSEGHCPEIDEGRKDKAIQLLGVCVLQLGIMIHSFVIGMTLAVTSAAHFASLLTAILFHQLFEGLSLGVRLASLPSHIPNIAATGSSSANGGISIRFVPPSLAFLFGITTPAGILVGLLVQKIMHADLTSEDPLLSGASDPTVVGGTTFRGVMAAISAGLLIYASCVELLAGDFVMDADLRKSPRGRQTLAVISLLAGAVGMAMIN
ncbi:hypothetical protein FRC04_003801 [Tulasnella sp. 424]|nr:hypothetical protein FRC04_003801 [Tulasnella sp. 424]KAG8973686.1 hypothetical protein FRC05_008273 [Tulasnella sp. 425]